jgi:hypothetical protein
MAKRHLLRTPPQGVVNLPSKLPGSQNPNRNRRDHHRESDSHGGQQNELRPEAKKVPKPA